MKNFNQIKNFLLNVFFPKFCLGCGQEGTYFCEDCQACLEISEENFCLCENPKRLIEAGKCRNCQPKKLDSLYFAGAYQNKLIKKLIHQFKYEPFIKELAGPLTDLIITHFLLLKKSEETWKGKILIPIPLFKRNLKRRGFNQAEEITKNLAKILEIPSSNCLVKIKETPSQTELSGREREKNIKGTFSVKNKELIKNRKVILVDDIYTTGATMNEAAKILKEAGAKEVEGIVVARGSID